MGDRGKQSAASLEVVAPGGVSAVRRPDPPPELTEEQAHEWRCVVNRMPADWFPRETFPLLAAYCRHTVNARRVSEMVEKMALVGADPDSGEVKGDSWLNDYDRLLKMQEREGRALSSLATRMRISQHAQYNHKKKTGTSVKKPWE